MTPAKEVYQAMGYPDSLEHDLADYLRGGYVIRTPDVFVMGKPVDLTSTTEAHEQWRGVRTPDAWYIKLLIGSLRALMALVPFELPRVCFERWVRGSRDLRIHDYYRVRTLALIK